MAKFEIIMPKMGESIIEATITKWLIEEGEKVEEDDSIVEIATDKVDSEIPSPVDGTLVKRLFSEGDVVPVGEIIAIINIDSDGDEEDNEPEDETAKEVDKSDPKEDKKEVSEVSSDFKSSDRFYSPLVRNIAKEENIKLEELEKIEGSGSNNRLTKDDLLKYIEEKKGSPAATSKKTTQAPTPPTQHKEASSPPAPKIESASGDTVVPMDRIRKIIAEHMVMSKRTSPHVTMFIDIDVTNIVMWRNKVKDAFLKREKEKITFTPIFVEAAAKVLKEFPGVNSSTDGENIIYRKNINIGMATALPNDNLIVPVIKNADQKNLLGLTKDVNDLATRARDNKLSPDEIQGGTFTITNFGSFNNLTGAPIINQPESAILGVGAIRKTPVVIDSPNGDMIGIRSMMIMSLAFDHRIVDGAMGGRYLQRLKVVLENFDVSQEI
ncbi:MAG: dihydrolipoamide acetyltransferase family protein [Bacteroidales bacterium]